MNLKLWIGITLSITLNIVSAQTTLHVIPTPKEVVFTSGTFEFNTKTTLCIENSGNETQFAANELITEIQNELGFSPKVVNSISDNQIVFCIVQRDKKASSLLKSETLSVPEKESKEGYTLSIKPKQIILAAYTETGLFYGVQTLKQIIRANRKGNSIPCLLINDSPTLRYRGWMDDISRGPIPTTEFIKKQIRTLAEYKLNYFNLYTENVFRSSHYPDLSPTDGLTIAEIQELTQYAAKYHMELMGNFQSFGHQEKMLSNPFYASLAENASILSPATEETYTFLSNIYSEMIPAYHSSFFNINCDETFGLGEGKSKAMADSIGESGIYAYHINRLDGLIKPYNKRLMMWGDIAVNNKEIIKQLPKDLIILSWGYQAAESFDDAILPFVSTGFDFMVAPGVSCWGELWPGLSNAAVNISNYTRDGAKHGAMGVMNTAWDDNGHNLFEYNWHGLILGAECAWSPAKPLLGKEAQNNRDEKLMQFNSNFDALFFQNRKVTNLYLRIDSLRFNKVPGLLSENSFWEDILNFYPSNTGMDYITANEEAGQHIKQLLLELKSLKESTKRNQENLNYPEFALNRALFTTHKNIVRAKLYNATQSKNETAIKEVKNNLLSLVNELHALKITYISLWNRENRNFWLDKNLNDYNKMADRLLNVDKQIYIEPANEIIDGVRSVSIRTLFDDQTIVYTTDGSDPVAKSLKYASPIPIRNKTLIKASVLKHNQPFGLAQKQIFQHKGIGHLKQLNSIYSNYNPAYAAGGKDALLDGQKGSNNFADGRWQGYQGQNVDIEIDLQKATTVKSISLDCLQNAYSWIILPTHVDIYTSADGVNYTLLKKVGHDIPADSKGQFTHTFQTTFDDLQIRFLKIVANSIGNLPQWHHAAGGQSFIFMDEIEIE